MRETTPHYDFVKDEFRPKAPGRVLTPNTNLKVQGSKRAGSEEGTPLAALFLRSFRELQDIQRHLRRDGLSYTVVEMQ
ncbi:hypothetical protein JJE66_27185 [Bradyrhizobium diazoefficiens]|uniref:hypothetical protein n=1 Tax=Bradyrhizobium diazoefficiens TaxID=1355477 RepID=UPI00190AA285|nr:hypothetical protein [Bradyrhizobium diazoefficiens]MBK3664899.1 hypothetical protein [Bradyrhizobium diazoefficiens]